MTCESDAHAEVIDAARKMVTKTTDAHWWAEDRMATYPKEWRRLAAALRQLDQEESGE
jgi:hypothetical protein